ncbi:hypothetical protein [Thiorhodococcus mannitoliphagus]|nr:hypothetical protein [Thiorhodococcus mannitoliphagus]
MSAPRLIFVYKADADPFSRLTDAAHKIISPQTYSCDLCLLTHGWLRERSAWRAFIQALPLACEFLHRDQLEARFPHVAVELPVVLRLTDAAPSVCLDAAAIRGCASLEDLMDLLSARCIDAQHQRIEPHA